MKIVTLIRNFPACDKIKGKDLEEILTECFKSCQFYQEVKQKIWDKIDKLWPYPNGSFDSPEYKEYKDFFYGNNVSSEFSIWLDIVVDDFISKRNWKRTYEEASQKAADKWCSMIFGHHVQNNGDKSSTGGMTSVLGTIGKEKAKQGISAEVVKKVNQSLKEYYLGGCKMDWGGRKIEVCPSCDYNPNTPLYNVLSEAGISDNDIALICPWKTSIYIDRRDNSVVVRGYRCESYI